MFLPMRKVRGAELLDRPDLPEADMRANLADLRRINRYLGGTRVVRNFLREELRQAELREATLLDVATGSADIPQALTAWCRRRGVRLRVTAVDRRPRHLGMFLAKDCRETTLLPVAADAFRLPFADASFTWVTASLLLHQFGQEESIEILRELYRLAQRSVLINDLERDWVPFVFMKLAWPLFARCHVSRYDSAVSIRQAFSPGELRELARRAGFRRFAVRRHFPYRLSLRIEKDSSCLRDGKQKTEIGKRTYFLFSVF